MNFFKDIRRASMFMLVVSGLNIEVLGSTKSIEVLNITPTPTSITLESNVTTVNVGDTVKLTVRGTYPDGSSSAVDENITYTINSTDNAEVNSSVLTAQKDGNVTVQATIDGVNSNTITLNIIWAVNGHVLPPEPDKALNDSTLLGIDVNDNGVRDDVERWIYEEHSHPIEIAIFMQLSKALQNRMGHSVEAWRYWKSIEDAVSCESYWSTYMKYVNIDKAIRQNKLISIDRELTPVQYNTQLRRDDEESHALAMSGGVIEDNGLEPEELIQACNFKIEGL